MKTAAGGPPGAPAAPRRGRGIRALEVAAVVAAVGLVPLVIAARHAPPLAFDLEIMRALQSVHGGWFVQPLAFLSTIGFPPVVDFIDGAILLALFLWRRRWEATAGTFGALGIAGLNALAKVLVPRPRPSPDLVHVEHLIPNSSFPAGHVMTVTAFFGFLIYLAAARMPPSRLRNVLVAGLLSVIVAMGPARIDAGEHWPSDVLGGYLLGIIWLAATIHFYRWGEARFARARSARIPMGAPTASL